MKLMVKKIKTKLNKEDDENNDKENDKRFWSWFLKQSEEYYKRNLMVSNY